MEKQRILIVDDSPMNLEALSAILVPDYTVQVAKSGNRAWEILDESPLPDLIILDVLMQGMDGYELCRLIKADERFQQIPVIFITVKRDQEDELQGLSLGAIDYISKPFRPSIVRARIENHLALVKTRQDLEAKSHALEEAISARDALENVWRHDLKNSLGIIIHAPEEIRDMGKMTPSQEKMLTLMEVSGYRILEMVNRSLDIAKMEQGSYTPKMAWLDIQTVLAQVNTEQKYLMEHKRASISSQLQAPSHGGNASYRVWADELLLHTLFSNLVRNALEATPHGYNVTLSIQELDGFTQIKLHNHGAVPEDMRARFFQKYATAGKMKGTGLGTYSAWLSMQTMGGSISLEPHKGDFTCITMNFPTPAFADASETEPEEEIIPEDTCAHMPMESLKQRDPFLAELDLLAFPAQPKPYTTTAG
ncbi:ATP-binding response regulator [Magnetococcus sp. PR-3]|uniref:ATP-binding response regulator n=1 Tax=Magnetococcus sp. PR-3 TaxID=3120355 RepID=UPI002FCDFB49